MADKEKGLAQDEAQKASSNQTTTKGKEQVDRIVAPVEETVEVSAIKDFEQVSQEELERIMDMVNFTTFREDIDLYGPEFWEFPYTARAMSMAYGPAYRWLALNSLGRSVEELKDDLTSESFKGYLMASHALMKHYENARAKMASGRVLLDGKPWPLMEDGSPDMRPISRHLFKPPYCKYYGTVNEKEDGIYEVIRGPEDFGTRVTITTTKRPDDSEIGPDHQEFKWPWDQYDALCALCDLIGEEALREAIVGEPEEADEIEVLARVKLDKMSVNHAFMNKVLDGLVDIAYGHMSFELTPRNASSKSGERYTLTASQSDCREFFRDGKANVDHVKCLLETIATLTNERRTEGLRDHYGRIWFSENSIVSEYLRTAQGTVNARRASASKRIVHNGLVMLTSARVKGEDANGKPIYVDSFLNARFRDEVTVNGRAVKDVWGFEDNATPANRYGKDLGHVYDYPLLDIPPMTIGNVWMRRYLLDVLNQARNALYTSSGNKTGKGKVTLKRSWAEIFRRAYPIAGEIQAKQKRAVVANMEEMLTAIAEAESKGEMREGRPIYIRAYSERDASKGRGKGAWLNLVMECSTSFHVPSVELS